MPPKGILVAHTLASENNQRSQERSLGAYWFAEEIADFSDIKHAIRNLDLSHSFEDFAANISLSKDLETELMHIGHMISSIADSKVDDFDQRLHEIQSKAAYYESHILFSGNDSERIRMWEDVTNQSLSLGSEVRNNLFATLKQVRAFGTKLNIDVTGDTEFKSSLEDASLYFPSQWNKVSKDELKLIRRKDVSGASYNEDDKEMIITNHADRLFTVSSINEFYSRDINDESFIAKASYVHELGHYYEKNSPAVLALGNAFRIRRGTESNRYFTQEQGGGTIYDDHFANSYSGRYYTNTNSGEIFTTGVEGSLIGSNGSLIGLSLPLAVWDEKTHEIALREGQPLTHFNPDPEHRNLVLGILASIELPNTKAKNDGFFSRFKPK